MINALLLIPDSLWRVIFLADETKEVERTEQVQETEQTQEQAFAKENQQPVSEQTKSYMEMAQDVLAEVNKVILGKKGEVAEIMTAFLANGHVLLEDIPGVGKTTLALAFSRAMGLENKRVQFTPDVLPSDLTGFSIYKRANDSFAYQEGIVFTNILLADEINRTSPKTQSALLEVMEERRVSVEGVTRDVPEPFLVIATQNPSGTAGTQYLPDNEIDRFMVTMSIGYPDFQSELEIAKTIGDLKSRADLVNPVITREAFLQMRREIYDVYVKDVVYDYLLRLVAATRNHIYIERGASPRATIALVKMARAYAWLNGRKYVVPNDVLIQLPYVLAHRIIMSAAAKVGSINKYEVIEEIARTVKIPYMGVKR